MNRKFRIYELYRITILKERESVIIIIQGKIMKIIGVIPARFQSSRFPGKPLAQINGKPMIWWVYNQVIKVNQFNDVYVATDSTRILDECNKYKIKAILTSDKHQTGTDRIGEVATKIKADFYVNIQGDEPLIEPETIERIVTYKQENPEVEVINSMTLIHDEKDIQRNTVVKVVAADNDDLLYLSRAPIPYPKRGQKIEYYKHLGLYGLSKQALEFYSQTQRAKNEKIEDIEMLRFLENGYRIKIVEVNSNSVGVDCPEDILRVEQKMKNIGIME